VLATNASRNFFCGAPFAVPALLLSQPWINATTHKVRIKRGNFLMIEWGELVFINFVLFYTSETKIGTDRVKVKIRRLPAAGGRRRVFVRFHSYGDVAGQSVVPVGIATPVNS